MKPHQLDLLTFLKLMENPRVCWRIAVRFLQRPPFPIASEIERVRSIYGNLRYKDDCIEIQLVSASPDYVTRAVDHYSALLGRDLHVLGTYEHQDLEYLVVDPSGVIYRLSVCVPDCWPHHASELAVLASSFEYALRRLLRGVRDDQDLARLKDMQLFRKEWSEDSTPASSGEVATADEDVAST